MNAKTDTEGAWIFISHSNKDLKKVREIRDFLERKGHKPLLFFLKALEKDDARLPPLIKDEIQARRWFVLCNSNHAKISAWVQEEVRLVKEMTAKGAFYVDIDLAADWEFQRRNLDLISKRATIFLSYARSDAEVADMLYQELIKQDYRVFYDAVSISEGDLWENKIATSIEEAVEDGFVLLLLSPNYLKSDACRRERQLAFEILGSRPLNNVVPVIVKDRPMVLAGLPSDLRHIQTFDLTDGRAGDKSLSPQSLERILELLAFLKQRPVA